MAASNKTGRVDKLLVKLRKSVQDKKFYEAHQMYRTLYFRYMAGNRYAEVIDLLYEGATALFENGQHTSGADLALLLVSVLEKTDAEATNDIIEKLSALYKAFNKQLVECSNFVNQAVKWSARVSGNTLGHPLLHQHFALTLWHEKNYAQARYHFERSNDGERCAMMLIEYHVTMGYPNEVDLFIAQSVLHFLCFKNKLTAEHCFVCYTTNHPMMESGPPFVRPLLNFLWLLMLAVEGGRLAAFTVLCEQYEPSIARDPCYKEYLDRIGQNFFGLPAPQQAAAPGGMFGSLLQSLFESAEDEDEETGKPAAAAAVGAGLDLD